MTSSSMLCPSSLSVLWPAMTSLIRNSPFGCCCWGLEAYLPELSSFRKGESGVLWCACACVCVLWRVCCVVCVCVGVYMHMNVCICRWICVAFECVGKRMTDLVFTIKPKTCSCSAPQDGRYAVEYRGLRGTSTVDQLLHDARTLDAYGVVSSCPE